MIQPTRKGVAENLPSRVELAIEEYLNQRGMINTEEWLGRYPDCTLELLEFLGNQSHLAALTTAIAGTPAVNGCVIGEYEILEVLDRGGMGIVYKARQKNLRRVVALKMIQQGQFRSPEVRKRFQNEAETAARLRHPNLVAIHEVGEHNGIPFFTMEYVKGRTLADLSRQGRIRPRVVAQIAQTIAETIHYIHSRGVLHRDLKPSNVMIDHNCEVRVTDFGLAKQLDRDYSLTETGQILGSIDYMPPEQAEARHERMGPASDVYSIGAILYELLAGKPPFRSESFLETLRQIREETPLPISQLNPRVPRALEAICLKCLQKKPSKRYQSAEELAMELQRFLDDEPAPTDTRSKFSRLVKSGWFCAVAGGMSATIVFAVCFLSFAGHNTGTATNDLAAGQLASNNVRNEPELPLVDASSRRESDTAASTSNTESTVVEGSKNALELQQNEKRAASAETAPKILAGAGDDQPDLEEEPRQADPRGDKVAQPIVGLIDHQFPVKAAIGLPGEPFGIAHIELEVPDASQWSSQPDKPLRLVADGGKMFYASWAMANALPAYRDRPHKTARLKIWYLFKGDDPPPVTVVSADEVLARNVTVETDDVREQRSTLLSTWLHNFSKHSFANRSPELESIKRFFDIMLARRMGVNRPSPANRRSASGLEVEFERTFGMLFGFESIRLAMMADQIPSSAEILEPASRLLPDNLSLPGIRVPEVNGKAVHVEALAHHVPPEAFYLRCFRVSNYRWVRNLVQGWGGDIDGVVATPAADYGIRERIESQLAFNLESLIGLGVDDEISDCALIGLDPFFSDGAAVGVLFEEKTHGNLRQIIQQCREKAAKEAQIIESFMMMGSKSVRVLQNHSKQIRSYYVVSGKYHLVTNSQVLAQRFVDVESGQAALGSLAEYSHAHSEVHAEGDCVGWLYLSDPFFRNITSAHYRIELQRRRRAKEDLLALHLARVASEAETGKALNIDDLIQQKFLPTSFNSRPDNSKPTVSEGVICDNVRGVPGTFVPIADMEFSKCTKFEADCYEDFKASYQREWRTVDPVLLMFNRMESANPGREKIVLNIHITPYAQQEYSFLWQHLSRLPEPQRIALKQNDLLSVSTKLHTNGKRPWAAAGLVDENLTFEIKNGKLIRSGANSGMAFAKSNAYALITDRDESSAYLLADFVSCLQSRKPLSLNNQAQPKSLLGAIVASFFPVHEIVKNAIQNNSSFRGETRVLSANRNLAEGVLEGCELNDAPRAAHMFMHLGDASGSMVYPYIRAWTYLSSRHQSAADLATMNQLADGLQEDPQHLLRQLETALGAKLLCPIGGEYLPKLTVCRPPYLVSNAWGKPCLHEENSVPADYDFPFLKWLHGLDLECRLGRVTLESRLELDIEAEADAMIEPIRDVTQVGRR